MDRRTRIFLVISLAAFRSAFVVQALFQFLGAENSVGSAMFAFISDPEAKFRRPPRVFNHLGLALGVRLMPAPPNAMGSARGGQPVLRSRHAAPQATRRAGGHTPRRAMPIRPCLHRR